MFSYFAILVYALVVATAVLTGIDAAVRLRGTRRPVTIIVLVLAIALLVSLLVPGGLVVVVPIVAVLLLVALIVQFVTDPLSRRGPLTIVSAILTVVTLVALWPVVGIALNA